MRRKKNEILSVLEESYSDGKVYTKLRVLRRGATLIRNITWTQKGWAIAQRIGCFLFLGWVTKKLSN